MRTNATTRLLALAGMLCAWCGLLQAQSVGGDALSILSDHQCLYRVDVADHYLLLPVQEKEENALVHVIVDNKEVQALNVRLAVDKVDYYVPLDITRFHSDHLLLDITFRGDRRTTGAVKDFIVWRELNQAAAFDTANREHFRPAYHHTPAYGWMNDPNGMFYKDGVYHLYYQWNPYGSQWENMTWGHSTSTDLVTWHAEPTAIEPDALGTIFSGSCVVDKDNTAGYGRDAVVAFYTSAAQSQVQSTAFSTDGGTTFTKSPANPVLTSHVPDFRDPKAFWNDDIKRWNLILAAGQEMQIYSSADLKTWTYESSFGTGYGCHDGVWECPDLMKMPVAGTDKSKWMLICNINPGGPFGGSATQYFVGDFDGRRFICDHHDTRWMDYGKDHYATVTFSNAPQGRHIALAWMSNWQYANQVPTRQFRSANSVPRDLGLFQYKGETYCSVTPSPELLAIRGKRLSAPSEACEIVVDVKPGMFLVLANDRGEQVEILYDARAEILTFIRQNSGDQSFSEAFAATTVAPTHGKVKQLRIFVDRCSIEVFDVDGKAAITNLVFPSVPYDRLKVNNGKATIYQLNVK